MKHYFVMQVSNDPTLTAMANRLAFFKQWDQGLNDTVYLDKRKSQKMRNAYFVMQNRKWFVKLSLGGRQLILGITENGYAATRFADACLVRFWPYRKRRAIIETDVNYSLRQANEDLAEGSECRMLIDAIEKHLLGQGTIRQPEAQAVSERIATPAAARRTLLLALREYELALRSACGTLTELSPDSSIVVSMALENFDVLSIHTSAVSQHLNNLATPT